MTEEKEQNPMVTIAATIGGISIGIVAIVAVFASSQLSVCIWIIASLSLMGVVLGYFAQK